MEDDDKHITDYIRRFGLVVPKAALEGIRKQLFGEISNYKASDGDRDAAILRLCCLSLFAGGNVEDTELIWRAKMLSQDSSSIIDTQFLCGAGIEQTKEYLKNQPEKWAQDLLVHLEELERHGEFQSFEPQSYLRESLAYYDDFI